MCADGYSSDLNVKEGQTSPDRPLDLICLGRVAVDFYSEQIGRSIEGSQTFAKYLGGSTGNIAVGTARLGLKSSMLTRVGDEALGRFLRRTLEIERVDVSHVVTDKDHLTGLAILGIDPPSKFPMILYRENCADMQVKRTDADDSYLSSAKALLFNGTCLSEPAMHAETTAIVRRSKELGAKILFDIDYRPATWKNPDSSKKEMNSISSEYQKVLQFVDLLVGTQEEFQIAGGANSLDKALSLIRSLTDAILVVKKGPDGCVMYPDSLGNPIMSEPFPVTVLNAVGAGDAFMSGFLYSWLRGKELEACAQTGNAAGAIVVTRHGCAPAMPSEIELNYFMRTKQIDSTLDTLHATMNDRVVID
ncbi:MAG: 5-dehydro-2-deoxygluconokinase [bacterium]